MQRLHQNMDHLYSNHIKQHGEQHAKKKHIYLLIDILLMHYDKKIENRPVHYPC
jgi:hypothetical protein